MLDSPHRQGLAFIVTSMPMQQPTRGAGATLPTAMPAPAADSSSFLLLAFTAVVGSVVLVVAVAIARYNRRHRGLRLPPGPPGWPVVGNLFQVAFSGKLFIHYIRDLLREYGPILTLRMGERTIVVISSAELAHEAFVVKNRFVLRMRAEVAASPDGASVWVLRNARFAVFCILLDMTFGLLDLDEEHIVHIDAVMKRVLLAVGVRMDDYLPFLRPFFWRQQRRALAVRREQIDTLLPLINRRRAILRDMQSSPPNPNVAAPFSYLDSVLDLNIEGRDVVTDDELVTLCAELLNGGTDTTATAIEWAMARIVDNPSIQARLHEEIMQQVGDARPVDDKDIDSMPYLQAFVKELLRKHPPTYFALTHAAVQPGSKLAGYDVPTDANLDIFLPTISEDPKLWERPTEFDPDRFLSGGETADMTGSAGIRMIPFGAGRRICPGLAMGTTHIALMVARMVQAFEWRAHPSQQPLDFKDKVEFTVVMARPLLATVKPRNLSF
ncbi:cytochrome P450 77A4-like [Phragmites australis]|uniref:cytochrome P450 77A4-like n=1 Tax=Phragmites australis TaxID=29695 RepID=UPI002D78E31B|nr:cytochrome P450 77A4-like [Phragmites australis]